MTAAAGPEQAVRTHAQHTRKNRTGPEVFALLLARFSYKLPGRKGAIMNPTSIAVVGGGVKSKEEGNQAA